MPTTLCGSCRSTFWVAPRKPPHLLATCPRCGKYQRVSPVWGGSPPSFDQTDAFNAIENAVEQALADGPVRRALRSAEAAILRLT